MQMTTRAPTCFREFMELLGTLKEDENIGDLFNRVNWSDVKPRQIYSAILGRLPELSEIISRPITYSPAKHTSAALSESGFRTGIISRILQAYPEKRRLFFVHVPKCAGTDLTEHLKIRYPWLHASVENHIAQEDLVRWLGAIASQCDMRDCILVCGHISLDRFLRERLVRFNDKVFTVIRDPYKRVISSVNYVVRRLLENPTCSAADTTGWARMLGITEVSPGMNPEAQCALADNVLFNDKITKPDIMCRFLGRGNYESAIELMAIANIEVADVSTYNNWLEKSWEISKFTQKNKAPNILVYDSLSDKQKERVWSLCKEDLRLYNHIKKNIRATGQCSIFGEQLI